MKKSVLKVAAASSLAFLLAGCEPDAADVQKAGLVPVSTPDRTLTCYDYNGNRTIQEKPTASFYFSSSYGYVEGNYAGGRKPTYVAGSAGCVGDSIFFDAKAAGNADMYKRAIEGAPYTVVVTNGMDKILLADKFSSVRNSSGPTTLELKINGVVIRKVSVQGLSVIATENREGIDSAITEGMKNTPRP